MKEEYKFTREEDIYYANRLIPVLLIIAFIFGYELSYLIHKQSLNLKLSKEWPFMNTTEETIQYYKDSKEFCIEVINTQEEALKKAEIVMDNNGLFDSDGSDDMSDYLDLCSKVDSLNQTQL